MVRFRLAQKLLGIPVTRITNSSRNTGVSKDIMPRYLKEHSLALQPGHRVGPGRVFYINHSSSDRKGPDENRAPSSSREQ